MYFLLSGEGITDMGSGQVAGMICEGSDYLVGPMAMVAAKIVEAKHSYSFLDGACGLISESSLCQRAAEIKAAKKQLRLPGRRQAKETRYFFNNARLLAKFAKEKAAALDEDVVAILFRDADGTASAGRGEWAEKRQSMENGFDEEGFSKGVPMLPKPKLEAWLICAWKSQSYQGCEALEERSGNDRSPKNLKDELGNLFDDEVTRDSLCRRVEECFDIGRVEMSSFKEFRKRLEEVIS